MTSLCRARVLKI